MHGHDERYCEVRNVTIQDGVSTQTSREAFDEVVQKEGSENLDLCAVFQHLAQQDPRSVRVIYVQGDWIDINSLDDVARSGDV